MVKKVVSLRIDEELWEEAKQVLSQPIAEYISERLKYAVSTVDDKESIIIKEIAEKHEEINVLESQLCSLREKRLNKEINSNSDMFDNAMETVNRIHRNMGSIGKNQIKDIAKRNDLRMDMLLDHCIHQGLNIENFGGSLKYH